MAFILLFLVVNIVLAKFFAAKKWKLAMVSHAVLFALVLFCVFVTYGGPVATLVAKNVGLSDEFRILRYAFSEYYGEYNMLAPMLTVEIALFIITLAVCVAATAKIVEVCLRMPKKHVRTGRKSVDLNGIVRFTDRKWPRKLYILNCVMIR